MPDLPESLTDLESSIVNCRRCPRLTDYIARITPRPGYNNLPYWNKPVPGWGDPFARLLILGLAPAAHGGNRTGRSFTGDDSANFLFAALHRHGFASSPRSFSATDDQLIQDIYIANAVRCAPPGNRPLPSEVENCRNFLVSELALLPKLCLILCLGQLAYVAAWQALVLSGLPLPRPRPAFAHAAEVRAGPYLLVLTYHPGRRNTNTRLLTPAMFDAILARCKSLLNAGLPIDND